MMNKFTIGLMVLLSLFSCRKEIDFNGDTSESRLVVNGVVEMDSTFAVNVEKSTFFLDNNFNQNKFITSGATLTLENQNTGEIYVVTDPLYGSYYEFPFMVTPNTSYSIKVEHESFNTVTSSTQTLSKTPIINVDTTSLESEDGQRLQFSLNWNDPAGEENYYMIRVKESYDSIFEYGSSENFLQINSKDPSVEEINNSDIDGSTYDLNYLLLSDALFNGAEKTIDFSIYHPFYWSEDSKKIEVMLISMNKETYLYFKSVQFHQPDDFFSEPVKIYNNIEEGFGIFGFLSYSVVTYTQ